MFLAYILNRGEWVTFRTKLNRLDDVLDPMLCRLFDCHWPADDPMRIVLAISPTVRRQSPAKDWRFLPSIQFFDGDISAVVGDIVVIPSPADSLGSWL